MAVFSGLSERINHVFSKLKSRGSLTELEIKQAMREVRVALLEADVNIAVAKDFIKKVTEKAVGEEILKGLNPAQQVIKIVNEELTELMGSTQSKLVVSSKLPTIIMMCGLQGAGKTTMCGKLAIHLKKQGKKPLLVACDIYRPAAIKQLKIVSEKAGAGFFEQGQQNPAKTAKQAVEFANKNGFDTVIVDTAGRLHINEELMDELKQVKASVDVDEILLTVDAMTGQDAVTVAEAFDKALDVTGIIMTKLDGDTRGGATLSIKAVTGKPIKFCGTGEKLEDIEVFHPDRMASRILGMGDVLSLIDKAQEAITQEDAAKLAKKLKDQSFDLNDYLAQFENLQKMGGIKDLVGMLPGMGKLKISEKDIDEKELLRFKAIIQSMTPKERSEPKILNYTRKKRIAAGSGTSVQDVNKLVKNFEQTKEMMKRFGKGKKGMKLPF
ncbi:MAG: signal recognition particle protein [Clostridia bacterium]|nr:signal recognition particle protein [Clostridia bacterium]